MHFTIIPFLITGKAFGEEDAYSLLALVDTNGMIKDLLLKNITTCTCFLFITYLFDDKSVKDYVEIGSIFHHVTSFH